MREYVDFSLKNKTVYLDFDKYTCFKYKEGRCSLDCLAESTDDDPCLPRYDINYCVNIFKSIKERGFIESPSLLITKYSCGHYVCDDGRHRICICGRKDIPIKILKENIQIKKSCKCYACIYKDKKRLIKF